MKKVRKSTSKVLVVGAGDAGSTLARHLALNYRGRVKVVGFIDDDRAKYERLIEGIPVLGGRDALREIVHARHVDEILIAIPSASSEVRRQLLDASMETSTRVRLMPSLDEIMSGRGSVYQLRELTASDLLGREPITVNLDQCRQYIAGKRVLVLGAAGSVGSELARQLQDLNPEMLLLADLNESGLFDLEQDLLEQRGAPIKPCICDITLPDKVDALFGAHKPEVVFHAAAFKHVPLMEQYPEEAVRVNILGTINVGMAAKAHGAERFVSISTDKAVNASSVMGATKRVGERIVSALGDRASTLFCSVRFGNVFGSRGSVVPLFERQIARGGPVTVTNPDMTRYFMALEEAAALVLQAGALASAGDLFILDMGEPVRIGDLATNMIRARGLRVGEDIEIVYCGTRPGEKLHEELIHKNEQFDETAVPGVRRVSSPCVEDWEELYEAIERLRLAVPDAEAGRRDRLVQTLFALTGSDERQRVPSLRSAVAEAHARRVTFSSPS